jgi:hypothetical protein
VEKHNESSINVSLEHSPNITRLEYYTQFEIRATDNHGNYFKASQAFEMKTWVLISGLQPGTRYCIQAKSSSVNGKGDASSCYNYTFENGGTFDKVANTCRGKGAGGRVQGV